MESTTHQPPLIRLPAELRNTIHEPVLCGGVIHVDAHTPLPIFLGLRLTCRQIHDETKLLLLSKNIIHVDSGLYLQKWLSKRDIHQQAAISTMRLGYMTSLWWGDNSQDWHPDFCRYPRHNQQLHESLAMLPSLRNIVLRVKASASKGRYPTARSAGASDILPFLLDEFEDVEARYSWCFSLDGVCYC
jgi:hypothetical protein